MSLRVASSPCAAMRSAGRSPFSIPGASGSFRTGAMALPSRGSVAEAPAALTLPAAGRKAGGRPSLAGPCAAFVPRRATPGSGTSQPRGRAARAAAEDSEPNPMMTYDSMNDSTALPENSCIIEYRENVKDFANMQLEEINLNVESRRNKIFLLMEEVRRLRIQQRIKMESSPMLEAEDEAEKREFNSVLPYLPALTEDTLDIYWRYFYGAVAIIIIFGGLVAPTLEVRLGLGGTSYKEFIEYLHLPGQLADVDPIVASFCGGAVGVLSALMVIEVNNVEEQAKELCVYCRGSGYLGCGECAGSGNLVKFGEGTKPGKAAAVGVTGNCSNCSGTGKVMCTSCLCTGRALATEHDPRADPFN